MRAGFYLSAALCIGISVFGLAAAQAGSAQFSCPEADGVCSYLVLGPEGEAKSFSLQPGTSGWVDGVVRGWRYCVSGEAEPDPKTCDSRPIRGIEETAAEKKVPTVLTSSRLDASERQVGRPALAGRSSLSQGAGSAQARPASAALSDVRPGIGPRAPTQDKAEQDKAEEARP